jgi:hypothetical protein
LPNPLCKLSLKSLLQALVIAAKSDRWQAPKGLPEELEIYRACFSLLLFGVPNLGLSHEQLTAMVKYQPNQNLIDTLMVDIASEPTAYLRRLHEDFRDFFAFPDSPVTSYFELHHSRTVVVRHRNHELQRQQLSG